MNQVPAAVRTSERPWPQILLLEDEPSVAHGLQMVLCEEGYTAVELAMTGRGALESFQSREVDLLIADLRLPDIDGLEVIKEVMQVRPDTGVIVITGYSTVASAVTAMKLGALDYLAKPFTEDEFVSAVRRALSPRRGMAALAEPAVERPTAEAEKGPVLRLLREDPARVAAVAAELAERFSGKPEEVISMLQLVQTRLGYLPENALEEIAALTGRSTASVFGTATFYEQFRLSPVGRHIVRVCRGTACHVKGSDRILKEIETRFALSPGETSSDRLLTLETVACFGSCAIAPVVVMDRSVMGRMNPAKTCECLARARAADGTAADTPPETTGER
jgi:NADH-quinone oxidoreductase subunit E